MRYVADAAGYAERLRVLRRMSPERRLRAALELSELTRVLFAQGLRRRFPHLSDADFRKVLRERLDLCHSRTS